MYEELENLLETGGILISIWIFLALIYSIICFLAPIFTMIMFYDMKNMKSKIEGLEKQNEDMTFIIMRQLNTISTNEESNEKNADISEE